MAGVRAMLVLCCLAGLAHAERPMERLGRGVVAVRGDGGVLVSWRLLRDDPPDAAFNVYRNDQRLTSEPIVAATCYLDTQPQRGAIYRVEPIFAGVAQPVSSSIAVSDEPYLTVPLQTPDGYQPNDASVGDLDGDGEYELVVKMENTTRDNSQRGTTDPVYLHAYKLDGTLLWSIDLGVNIRAGAHYTQFMVYDLDGDGCSEVACKTADGTTDGAGIVIGDPNADHRNDQGYILRGPEYLTVFDGRTGAALDTTQYLPQRAPDNDDPTPDAMKAIWGDDYGNRIDRFLAAVAYLDGQHPSLVFCRGYYTRTVLVAWDFVDGKLRHRWTFDSDDVGNRDYAGQGNHQLAVADVDADGRDEIIYGAMTIDDDGKGLYTTGLGHGDAMHVSDMLPERPGLEVFDVHEVPAMYGDNAVSLTDARTGEIIWGMPGVGDIGRGVAMDIDPRYHGYEMWFSGNPNLYTAGQPGPIADAHPKSINFGVWWDGDLLREVLDANVITKWDHETSRERTLLEVKDCEANNGTKSTPALCADILGDWREEVVWRTKDNRALRIYVTTIPTQHRLFTLMHDPTYRLAVAWQNVAYNQPPHPGFFLGEPVVIDQVPASSDR